MATPKNVRNFWITANDRNGRTLANSGPAGKDGEFELTVKQRDRATVLDVLTVIGHVTEDGKLRLMVRNELTDETFDVLTLRDDA